MSQPPEHPTPASSTVKVEPEAAEKPWWDNPAFPWDGEPSTQDKWCWAAFGLLGLYSLIMLPLRPLILAASPHALAMITGSSIAMVDIGAGIMRGLEPNWWFYWLAATVAVMRFDWIFWWAGKLWGDGIIRVMGGRSAWAARTARTAERFAAKWGIPLLFICWFIPFIPSAIICALVGAAGMRLRTFLLVDVLGALANRALYLYLGYRVGEPAKEVVATIAQYATWISIGLVVWIIFRSVTNKPVTAATPKS